MNVDIIAGEGDAATGYSTTVWATPTLGQVHVQSFDLPAVMALDESASAADIQAAGTRTALSGGPRIDLTLSTGAQAQAQTPTATAELPYKNCRVLATYKKIGVTLGQLSATVTSGGYTQKFSYTASASSTLGVGVVGANGAIKAGGSSTVGSEGTLNYNPPSTQGSKSMRTNYTYGKVRCTPAAVVPRTITTVRALEHTGGATMTSSTIPRATYCELYHAGTSYEKKESTATTFSAGVTSKGVFGINLSARSGYTNSAKISWSFSKDRDLCGTHGHAVGKPGRVVVRPVGSS